MPAYECIICKKTVSYEPPVPEIYPFCCERCKLVDLGRWFNEEYTAEGQVPPGAVEEPSE